MTTDETRKTFDAYIHTLLSGGDFAQHFAPDVVWTTMESGEQITGRDAVRDLIIFLHKQAFEARPEPVGLLIEGDRVVLEAVFVGRHIGVFAGISATGREVRAPYAISYDVGDGVITAFRAYFPVLAIREQLTQPEAVTRPASLTAH